MRSTLCACCRTGGSPRAPRTRRSGCGTWRPAPRPPASRGIPSRVSALCLLPDGRLASGSEDNTIRLWDVATGAETARLEGHAGAVSALCLLADGRLASGSDDNTIRLWDVATGAETARLEGHTRSVNALCLLPDGRLASGSWDKTIRLWDVATGVETARLEGHTERGRRSLPAAGRAARLGLLMTTRSGCGTWRPAPRPPASKGTPVVSRALPAAGRAARLGL